MKKPGNAGLFMLAYIVCTGWRRRVRSESQADDAGMLMLRAWLLV
jgi:hypothetical protein